MRRPAASTIAPHWMYAPSAPSRSTVTPGVVWTQIASATASARSLPTSAADAALRVWSALARVKSRPGVGFAMP